MSHFRVTLNKRCLCSPCWCARCHCGTWLTKHAFTEEDAAREAEHCLTLGAKDYHACKAAAPPDSLQEALL